MKRQTLILLALVALLAVVGFYFLAFQPQRDALADVERRIEAEQAQQVRLQSELNQLRLVREQAPAVEAALVATEAVVPRDAAIPSALRQLQTAAEDANLTLQTVSASKPAQVEDATVGLSNVVLNLELRGSYFQLVDFLRRMEDPSISPRGVLWTNIAIGKDAEDYPVLAVQLSGSMFTLLPAPPPEAPAEDATTDQADGETAEGDQ